MPPPGKTSRRFYSKKVSPKVPTGSYNIAQLSYELNVLGTRGPRRMRCVMHSIPASSVEPGGIVPGRPELLPRSLEDSFRSISSLDHSTEFSSSRFLETVRPVGDDGADGSKLGPLVLKNKSPRWHEQLQCWCLNFRGRVTVASVKNFQLIAATGQPVTVGGGGGPAASQPAGPQPDHDKVILQFGKVGKDMFTMDYRYPLSAFQAFAICLSSFDTKLACEWERRWCIHEMLLTDLLPVLGSVYNIIYIFFFFKFLFRKRFKVVIFSCPLISHCCCTRILVRRLQNGDWRDCDLLVTVNKEVIVRLGKLQLLEMTMGLQFYKSRIRCVMGNSN